MTAMTRRCPVCRSDTTPVKLMLATGEDAPLAVALRGMPALECPQGHRSFALAEFPLKLLNHLLEQEEPSLPVSQTKGLVFKHYNCSGCGAPLDPADDKARTFNFDVELPDFPAFGVDLTLPVTRCPQCGREQLHSLKELKRHTPAALAHAFKSAQLAAA